jgi:hypothetical protein
VDCINEVEIFNAPMTFEDLKAILSCKPKVIFRSNNNRQVAFLFSELSNRGLITPNWQVRLLTSAVSIKSGTAKQYETYLPLVCHLEERKQSLHARMDENRF